MHAPDVSMLEKVPGAHAEQDDAPEVMAGVSDYSNQEIKRYWDRKWKRPAPRKYCIAVLLSRIMSSYGCTTLCSRILPVLAEKKPFGQGKHCVFDDCVAPAPQS